MVLSSDEGVFGGYENASKKYNTEYATSKGTYDNRPNSFQVPRALFPLTCCCTIPWSYSKNQKLNPKP